MMRLTGYSALFSIAPPLPDEKGIVVDYGDPVGTLPDGTVIYHAEMHASIPDGATIYYDGTAPWTWNGLATDFPKVSAVVTPHEFFGEPTAADLDDTKFAVMVTQKAQVAGLDAKGK